MKRPLLSLMVGCMFYTGYSQQFSLIRDINPGAATSNICYLTAIGNLLYFGANNGINGMELWKSDGTEAGTVLLKDINPGAGSCSIGYLTNVNGTLFFVANDGSTGSELWKSDGTAAGTLLVKNIRSGTIGSNPFDLININGTLFFAADDGINGVELWKSDGTAAGTVIVKSIQAGTSGGGVNSLANVNGKLFFAANNGTNGSELWKSDGTTAGTVLVKDIQSGANGSSPSYLTAVGSLLFFTADNATSGTELWKSDGTAAGTVIVKDVRPGTTSSNPFHLKSISGTLFFSADNGTTGSELWKSDGTAAGTLLVKDIWPGAPNGTIGNFTELIHKLIFIGNDGVNGDKTWQSDGSVAGTKISSITTDGDGSMQELVETQTRIFASVNQTNVGSELWAVSYSAVLPLHVLLFSGKQEKETVSLQWTTSNEMDAAEFIIEKSIDGQAFQEIGEVAAQNRPGTHTYSFIDPSIGINRGQIYYRLKQVDVYDRWVYSRILTITISKKQTLSLFPNPANGQISLNISVTEKEKVQYKIFDNAGRLIMRDQHDLSAGTHSIPIDVSRFAPGVYFISLQSEAMNRQIQFIKQ